MPRRNPLGVIALLAWGASAAASSFISTSYLPKQAVLCERAVTHPNPNKYCKNCNQKTVVGAAESVTVQIGGCPGAAVTSMAGSQLVTVASFAGTGVSFSTGATAPSIKTNAITPATGTSLVIGGAGDTVTVPGNLVVTGTFTNPGGGGSSSCSCPSGIQTNTISPVTAGSTVTIPGSGPSSTAIGLSGECGMQSCN